MTRATAGVIVAGASTTLAIVSPILPWVSTFDVLQTSGAQEAGPVLFAPALAALVSLVLYDRRPRLAAALIAASGVTSAALIAVNFHEVGGQQGRGEDVITADWGLYLGTAAAIGLVASGIFLAAEARKAV